jgi:hypothetical protein
MELIAELEKEKRGVYAGAVGYFGYNTVSDGKVGEGAMDTYVLQSESFFSHRTANNGHKGWRGVSPSWRRHRI